MQAKGAATSHPQFNTARDIALYGGMDFDQVHLCAKTKLRRKAAAHSPRPYSAFRQAGTCSYVRNRTDPRLDSR